MERSLPKINCGSSHEIEEAPSLSSFEPGQEMVLMTDDSSKGLGAVFLQVADGEEKTILIVSRSLRGAESNYSVIEKEALGVFQVVRKLRKFLWGSKFVMKTDHKHLKDIFMSKGIVVVSTRICKWVNAVQEFNFGMMYVPGVRNILADCLSHMCCKDFSGEEKSGILDGELCEDEIKLSEVTGGSILEEEWIDEVKKDREFRIVKECMLSGWSRKEDCKHPECNGFIKRFNSVERDHTGLEGDQ